jgi:TolB-like protein
MHKNRVCAIVLFLVGIISTNFLSAQNISLDEAIQNAVNNIEDSLQQGTKVAILNFSSTSEKFTDYVIEELAIALVNGKKLVVVDRKDLELIRKEMNFQLSGEVSDESAQRIGVMLGAQSIISGSLVDTGSVYRFRVNTINVESAVREAASSLNINGGDEQTVFLLTGSKSTLPVQNNAASEGVRQNINNKRYKIGDVGPAG